MNAGTSRAARFQTVEGLSGIARQRMWGQDVFNFFVPADLVIPSTTRWPASPRFLAKSGVMLNKFYSLTCMIALIGTHCYGQEKKAETPSSRTVQKKNSDASRASRLKTVHELIDRAKAFNDLQIKTTTVVNLASLLWQHTGEEAYARQLFTDLHDELKLTAASQTQLPTTVRGPNIARLRQLVERSVGRFDSKLALAWFEEDLNGDDSFKAMRRLDFALDLASEGNSAEAARLARSAVNSGFSGLDLRLVLSMLHRLRALNQPAADSVFLDVLDKLSLRRQITPDDVLMVGNYLFIKDSDATSETVRYTGVTVGGLYFPVGISGERAGLTKQLVKPYLVSSLSVLNRQLSQPSVQFPRRYEATARMLLEKAQKFAPELVAPLTELAKEFSVSSISDVPFPSAESGSKVIDYESVAPELEKLQGLAHDERCIALIATAYLQNDVDTAARLALLLTDENGRALVQDLIAFRQGANLLEQNDKPGAEKIASQLKSPELIVLLKLGLANLDINSHEQSSALLYLQSMQTLLRDNEIKSRGLYLLNAAALFVNIDSNTALQLFDQAARAFDDSRAGITELTRREHLSTIRLGKTTAVFSLNAKSIPFHSVEDLIVTLFRHSQDQSLPMVLRVRNEKVLGPALVAVAKELLAPKTSSAMITQQ